MSMMDDIFKKLNSNQLDKLPEKLKEGFNVVKKGINQLSEEQEKKDDTIEDIEQKTEDSQPEMKKEDIEKLQQNIDLGMDVLKKYFDKITDVLKDSNEEEMTVDEYFSDDEYVNKDKDFIDYLSKLGDIGKDKYQEVKKQLLETFSANAEKNKSSIPNILEILTKYEQYNNAKDIYNKLKEKITNAKELYDNYKSLDEEVQKRIVEDNRKIQKEKIIELKKNFLLALDFFNELNQESEEYFKVCDQSIIEEINNKANEKNLGETKQELVKDFFESFINKVSAIADIFKHLDNYLHEEEMYKEISELLKQYYKVLEVYNTLDYNERSKYYEKVNGSCLKFYSIIEMYNEVAYSPISRFGEPIKMIDDKDKIYLDNTKMAITLNNQLDLFKIYHYKEAAPLYGRFNDLSYNEGNLYVGLTTDEVALNKKHITISNVDIWSSDKSSIMYDYKTYHVTSEGLKPSADFDKLRQKMYESKKQIVPYYGEGVTTQKELNDVINYGSYLYGLKKENQKIK